MHKQNSPDRGNYRSKTPGMSLVEVVVGAAIIGSSIVSIVGVYGGLSQISYRNTARIQAAMLLEEGTEALKVMRDFGWNSNIASLSTSTTYRFAWSSSTSSWVATTSAFLIDGTFDRTFQLSDVFRDPSYNIVAAGAGGTLDPGSKNATVTVSWFDRTATTSRSVNAYIFNVFNN